MATNDFAFLAIIGSMTDGGSVKACQSVAFRLRMSDVRDVWVPAMVLFLLTLVIRFLLSDLIIDGRASS